MKRIITFILAVLLCINSTMIVFAEEEVSSENEEEVISEIIETEEDETDVENNEIIVGDDIKEDDETNANNDEIIEIEEDDENIKNKENEIIDNPSILGAGATYFTLNQNDNKDIVISCLTGGYIGNITSIKIYNYYGSIYASDFVRVGDDYYYYENTIEDYEYDIETKEIVINYNKIIENIRTNNFCEEYPLLIKITSSDYPDQYKVINFSVKNAPELTFEEDGDGNLVITTTEENYLKYFASDYSNKSCATIELFNGDHFIYIYNDDYYDRMELSDDNKTLTIENSLLQELFVINNIEYFITCEVDGFINKNDVKTIIFTDSLIVSDLVQGVTIEQQENGDLLLQVNENNDYLTALKSKSFGLKLYVEDSLPVYWTGNAIRDIEIDGEEKQYNLCANYFTSINRFEWNNNEITISYDDIVKSSLLREYFNYINDKDVVVEIPSIGGYSSNFVKFHFEKKNDGIPYDLPNELAVYQDTETKAIIIEPNDSDYYDAIKSNRWLISIYSDSLPEKRTSNPRRFITATGEDVNAETPRSYKEISSCNYHLKFDDVNETIKIPYADLNNIGVVGKKIIVKTVTDSYYPSFHQVEVKAAKKFTIKYVNGGEHYNPTMYFEGEDDIFLANPIKTGYRFEGWYKESTFKNRVEKIAKGTNSNITLYAKWVARNYYLEYIGFNDGTYSPEYDIEGNYPQKYTYGVGVELPIPTKNGFEFLGWYDNSDFSGDSITTIGKSETGNKYLYPRFSKKHKITYHLDEYTINSIYNDDYYYEDDVLHFEEPSNPYYTFIEWCTDEGLTSYIVSTKDCEVDLDLYPHWSDEYKNTTNPPYTYTSYFDYLNGIRIVEKGALVDLLCTDANAVIYYTTDGNDPTTSSDKFDDCIVIEDNTTIKAFAVSPNKKPSSIEEFVYEIKNEAEDWGDILEEDRNPLWNGNADSVPKGIWITDIEDKEYTGKAITCPYEFRVYNNKTMLYEGYDYTVKYSNNTKVGTALATITCKGNYTGTFTTSFNIVRKVVHLKQIVDSYLVYKGKDLNVSVPKVVTYDGITLKNNTDFTYTINKYDGPEIGDSVEKITEAGEYIVTIMPVDTSNYVFYDDGSDDYSCGLENPENEVPYSYLIHVQEPAGDINISATKISGFKSSLSFSSSEVIQDNIVVTYNGDELSEGTDYNIEYVNNYAVGTATMIISGISDGENYDFYGSITKTFKITGTPLSKCKFLGIHDWIYPGFDNEESYESFREEIFNNIEIVSYGYDSDGEYYEDDLWEGEDYYISSYSIYKTGTATIVFQGINGYTGTVKKTFKIKPKNIVIDEDGNEVDTEIILSGGDEQQYLKGGVKPWIEKITVNGIELYSDEYTVSYKNNNKIGTATMTIKGKGNYTGTITKEFDIVAKPINSVNISVNDKAASTKANAYKSTVTLTDWDGKKLTAGIDYDKNIKYSYIYDTIVTDTSVRPNKRIIRRAGEEVSTKDIIPEGTEILVTVIGKGNYQTYSNEYDGIDKIYDKYRIIGTKNDISKAKVTIHDQFYADGKSIELKKSNIIVVLNNVELDNTDFDIIGYSNNRNKGTATVILEGKGEYGGIKNATFKIVNRATSNTVKFNANGGKGKMADMYVIEDSTLPENQFTKVGYTFDGWYTKKDGSSVSYNDSDTFTFDPYNLTATTLYAQWSANHYTIKFDSNFNDEATGDVMNDLTDCEYNKSYSLTDNAYERLGYVFKGWSLTPNGTVKYKNKASVKNLTTDNDVTVTLYAVWQQLDLSMTVTNYGDSSTGGVKITVYGKRADDYINNVKDSVTIGGDASNPFVSQKSYYSNNDSDGFLTINITGTVSGVAKIINDDRITINAETNAILIPYKMFIQGNVDDYDTQLDECLKAPKGNYNFVIKQKGFPTITINDYFLDNGVEYENMFIPDINKGIMNFDVVMDNLDYNHTLSEIKNNVHCYVNINGVRTDINTDSFKINNNKCFYLYIRNADNSQQSISDDDYLDPNTTYSLDVTALFYNPKSSYKPNISINGIKNNYSYGVGLFGSYFPKSFVNLQIEAITNMQFLFKNGVITAWKGN